MSQSAPTDHNLLTGLSSVQRMSRADQRLLDLRLRMLATTAKADGAITVAANLLRASYELEKA